MDRTSTLTIIVFLVYVVGVFVLAWLASRVLSKKSFLGEYFLGSRGLGTWALAFTFAATSASGGSFGGYPSLIYSYGWILALWIAGYMIFPLTTMGVMGKRLNQVARKSGAITIPDVLRDRFDSPALGLFTSATIVFFTLLVLVSQFKLGALIIEDTFNLRMKYGYVLSLFVFAAIVVIYTSFGGFRAVVWTDVMQGIVMGLGVLVLVPIVLEKAGGLSQATQRLLESPPTAIASVPGPPEASDAFNDLVFRALAEPVPDAVVFRKTAPSETLSYAWESISQGQQGPQDQLVLLFPWSSTTGTDVTGNDVRTMFANTPELASQFRVEIPYKNSEVRTEASGAWEELGATGRIGFPPASDEQRFLFKRGAELAFGPGRHSDGTPFHPLGLMLSYFFIWSIAGIAHPGMMVRLMAFRDSRTLKRSILTVAIYYSFIYLPLIFIVMAARDALPTLPPDQSDRTIVLIATRLVAEMGLWYHFLGALFVAAPFAAVMSTVDSFLLLISSSAVRDIYQRSINPSVSDRAIARISYATTLLAGVIVTLLALRPPNFLQVMVVVVSGGFAATFLCPMLLGLYWRNMTRAGALSAAVGGFVTTIACYAPVLFDGNSIHVFGLDPIIPSLAVSFALGVGVSKWTGPPPQELISKYF